MEYPINNPENNPYANRGMHPQRRLNSSSVMGIKVGSSTSSEQLFRSCIHEELNHSSSSHPRDAMARGSRSRSSGDTLQLEKSPVKNAEEPSSVPSTCPSVPGSTSSFRSNNYSNFNYSSATPYCNHLNDRGIQTASRYTLPQSVQGSDTFASGTVYSGNIHTVSQQMYSHYGSGFVPSGSLIDSTIDIGTNSTSCRINNRQSRLRNMFEGRSSSSSQCSGEQNVNTYEWMKIKRNPPKNCKFMFKYI